MSLPVISLVRGWPTDARELMRLLNDLNRAVVKSGTRVHASDQRFSNQIGTANKQSTQSTQPLTSTDLGGGFADIAIASHSVQYSFGTVSYSSGTILGLANSTLYYVFADDPNYEGGAVAYEATTNANNITAELGRYYVGKITTDAPAGGGSSGGYGGGGGGGGFPLP
jgi:hypothetical protein